MRKKLFAILMSAMMMVTFMPAMAFADPATAPDYNDLAKYNLKDLTGFEHNCWKYADFGVQPKSETVVAPTCDSEGFEKLTFACGDTLVKPTEGKKGHNHVVKEMTLAEIKDLGTTQITNWIYDLVRILNGRQEIKDQNGDDTVDAKDYKEKIAHLLLGISPADAALAQEAYERIMNAVKAFKEAEPQTPVVYENNGKGYNVSEALQKLMATVTTVLGDYFASLGQNLGGYVLNNTQLGKLEAGKYDSAKYCYFIVDYCDVCEEINKIGGYTHTKPADLADCATSYVCEHCGKTITDVSHFQNDAITMIGQANRVYKAINSRPQGENPAKGEEKSIANELSILANEMYFMDSNPHKLSVTSEKKACGEVYTIACSECGDSVSYTLPTSLKHNFQWKELVPASCKGTGTKGLKVQVCEDCNAINLLSFTEVLPKHSYSDQKVDATCDAPGFTCKVCDVCGNILPLTSKDFTAPTGHDYDIQMVVEPSCEYNGLLKIGCKNAKCRTRYYLSSADLDADAINISSWKELTSKSEGNLAANIANIGTGIVKLTDYLHENEDHYYFVGYNFELIKNPIELTTPDKKKHKFTTWVVAEEATCTHGTVWAPKCSKCGLVDTKSNDEYLFEDTSSKLEHNWKTYEVEKTCEHAAGTIKVCQACKEEHCYNTDGFEVKHGFYTGKKCMSDNEWVTIKDATFTEVGMRVTHCVHCGGIVVREDVGVKKLAKAYQPTLKAGKKQMTVKFKNASKAATGYQIAYKVSGANNYKYVKTTFKNSKTIKNLKAGKKYTVKVRAYVEENGKTVYGKWCAVKYVKVK